MANYARYIQDGESIDYTPSQAVNAGQVVVLNDMVGVAKKPIAASALGAIYVVGVFEFPKATTAGTGVTAGTKVYWDATNNVITSTAGANKYVGKTVADCADADAVVRVRLCP